MEKNWLIAILLFLIFTFLFWRFTREKFNKEYGKSVKKLWTARLYYWQAAIYAGAGVAFLLMFVLRWANILTF